MVEGENVVIHLQEAGEGRKSIQKIEAVKAHGTDDYPHRKLQYAADQLWVDFNDDGVAQKITGADQRATAVRLGRVRDHRHRVSRGDGLRHDGR